MDWRFDGRYSSLVYSGIFRWALPISDIFRWALPIAGIFRWALPIAGIFRPFRALHDAPALKGRELAMGIAHRNDME